MFTQGLVQKYSQELYSLQPQTGNNLCMNGWLNGEIVVYSHNGIPLNNKKELLIYATTWINLKSIMLNERRQKTQNV